MLELLTSPEAEVNKPLSSSSWHRSGESCAADGLRMPSISLLGDGVVVIEDDVTGVVGGESDVTSAVSLAFSADEVMLARRCWKDPGGARGSDMGATPRIAVRPVGGDIPSDEKAAA